MYKVKYFTLPIMKDGSYGNIRSDVKLAYTEVSFDLIHKEIQDKETGKVVIVSVKKIDGKLVLPTTSMRERLEAVESKAWAILKQYPEYKEIYEEYYTLDIKSDRFLWQLIGADCTNDYHVLSISWKDIDKPLEYFKWTY